MTTKWIKTEIPGIRFREHPTRKHGIRADRYYSVRFQVNGKAIEQGLGWSSQGVNQNKAAAVLAELRQEAHTGAGSGRLADRRKAQAAAEEEARQAEEAAARAAMTLKEFYHRYYEPEQLVHKKANTALRERGLHEKHILPSLGARPVRSLVPLDFERVKRSQLAEGKAPRTVEYLLVVAKMLMGTAIKLGYHPGPNPVNAVKRLKFDNKKTRFLSVEEANDLLAEIKQRSMSAFQMSLLALHCGLRRGEVNALRWGSVDVVHKTITLKDTKSGRSRSVPMTSALHEMFVGMSAEQADRATLVFPDRQGKERVCRMYTFDMAVKALGLNDGVADRREKITFHSWRHTFASWHAMNGTDLLTLQRLLGHATTEMTLRYAHLAPSHLQTAVNNLESAMAAQSKVKPIRAIGGRRG